MVKLTKRQRNELVTLMKCAADEAIVGGCMGAITRAVAHLSAPDDMFALVMRLYGGGPSDEPANIQKACALLEAARLVEEGVLP